MFGCGECKSDKCFDSDLVFEELLKENRCYELEKLISFAIIQNRLDFEKIKKEAGKC